MAQLLGNLSEKVNFCSPWKHQKTIDFLMVSGGIEVDKFAQIYLILEAKFDEESLDWFLLKYYAVKFDSTKLHSISSRPAWRRLRCSGVFIVTFKTNFTNCSGVFIVHLQMLASMFYVSPVQPKLLDSLKWRVLWNYRFSICLSVDNCKI